MTDNSGGSGEPSQGNALIDYAYLSAIHAVDPADAAGLAALLAAASPAEQERFGAIVKAVREALAAAAFVVDTEPTPALRARLLAHIPDRGPSIPVPTTRRRPRAARRLALLAAAIVAVAAVGAGAAYQIVRQHEQSTTPLQRQASAPITGGGTVELTYQPDSKVANARFTDLPPSPAGHSYQMWLITDSVPHPAGLISDRSRSYTMEQVRPGDRFAITVEPAAGSAAPTKKPIVVVSVPS